jgi:hypothetical protein
MSLVKLAAEYSVFLSKQARMSMPNQTQMSMQNQTNSAVNAPQPNPTYGATPPMLFQKNKGLQTKTKTMPFQNKSQNQFKLM